MVTQQANLQPVAPASHLGLVYVQAAPLLIQIPAYDLEKQQRVSPALVLLHTHGRLRGGS